MTTQIPIVEEANAPAEIRALYAEFRERFGRPQIPGILKCFATHPPLLEHMMGLAESMLFREGALGRCNKELIATFLSARNQCSYCADSHGASLLQQGGSTDLLQAAMASDHASTALEPPRQALLLLLAKSTTMPGGSTPTTSTSSAARAGAICRSPKRFTLQLCLRASIVS